MKKPKSIFNSVSPSRQSFGLAPIIAVWATITTTSGVAGVPINNWGQSKN